MYEWVAKGRDEHNYPWRHEYDNDLFRSMRKSNGLRPSINLAVFPVGV